MLQVNDNYFQLFDLNPAFAVDLAVLEQKYHELQNKLHPDRFAGESERERMQAVQLSSYLNEAYNTLRKPLARAAYLLQLRGRDTERAARKKWVW
ncbi:MAG: Fe-S protein assembly co-chaperone HscB, partial [Gammaproteobacteria bacterium]